jgi:hypothetical protein
MTQYCIFRDVLQTEEEAEESSILEDESQVMNFEFIIMLTIFEKVNKTIF